jgi:hypothetical protein
MFPDRHLGGKKAHPFFRGGQKCTLVFSKGVKSTPGFRAPPFSHNLAHDGFQPTPARCMCCPPILQPALVLAEHFGHAADHEDGTWR